MPDEHCWAIKIRSKYTGQGKILGSKYQTLESAQAYAEKEICQRCNGVNYIPVAKDGFWIDSERGFLSGERLKAYTEQRIKEDEKEICRRYNLRPAIKKIIKGA